MRQSTTKSILNGVWQGLRTVRSYHYDDKKGELLSCQGRKNCVKRLKWEQLKRFRESLHDNNQDPDDYATDQLLQ
ncbi:hypothetical protein L3Y34_007104 [Caenorhabditis briggsae]|uniref:Uncharacterized protein n=1 Tax=Caenorhabditis briggsae TaxID=6238 RepID=A0AAE9D0E6_CAEBR|nr:hypothetical protein L3Y34_007104 [Caenorhabditis briggsae]